MSPEQGTWVLVGCASFELLVLQEGVKAKHREGTVRLTKTTAVPIIAVGHLLRHSAIAFPPNGKPAIRQM